LNQRAAILGLLAIFILVAAVGASTELSQSHSQQTETESTSQTVGTSTIFPTTTGSTTTAEVNTSGQVFHILHVDAKLLNNNTELTEAHVVVWSQGLQNESSTPPAMFTLPAGRTYSITINDISGLIFGGWNLSAGSRTTTVSMMGDVTMIANYKLPGSQTISVSGRDLAGKSVAGVSTYLYDKNGVKIASDVIPTNFTVNYGGSYTVVADSHAFLAFKHWNNNLALASNRFNVDVTGNLSLTADYQRLPYPYTPHGRGNYTITVVSHTMDGGELVGMYFQVRINGVWNHVADGYTPASVSVPAGNEEVVMYHCAQVSQCSEKFFVYRYWNNTSPLTLTRWQYIDIKSDVVLNSFYEIIPATDAVHVTIEAMNSTGPIFVNCTCGSVVTINNSGGTSVAQSLEPYSFWLWKGRGYTVTVGDLPGYLFKGWTTGATSYTISFVAEPQDPASLTQYFAAMYTKK
jgi:hypothetical protein